VPLVYLTEEELEKGITMVVAAKEGIDLKQGEAPSSSSSTVQAVPEESEVGPDGCMYPAATSHAFSAPDPEPSAIPQTKAERIAKAKENLANGEKGHASGNEAAGSKGGGYAGSNPSVAPAKLDSAKASKDDAGEEKMEIEGLFDDISSDEENDKK